MTPARLWADLHPDPSMLSALDEADAEQPRRDILHLGRTAKNNWSNRFADACARMVADALRRNSEFRHLTVRPLSDGASEPLTFVAGGRRKKVDVIVSSVVSGLQVGISLKGMNFRDGKGGQFDKNLTGRTYELQDEVSVIHRYQPASFLVGLYFLPIAATCDKRSARSLSSFARVVAHLRERTGRLDPTLPSQIDRVDLAAVALYVPGDSEGESEFDYRDTLPRGVVRYFDVRENPPKRGRPRLESTLDLDGLVESIVRESSAGGPAISWSEPEPD